MPELKDKCCHGFCDFLVELTESCSVTTRASEERNWWELVPEISLNSPIVMTSEQEGKQGKGETTMRVSKQYRILH